MRILQIAILSLLPMLVLLLLRLGIYSIAVGLMFSWFVFMGLIVAIIFTALWTQPTERNRVNLIARFRYWLAIKLLITKQISMTATMMAKEVENKKCVHCGKNPFLVDRELNQLK